MHAQKCLSAAGLGDTSEMIGPRTAGLSNTLRALLKQGFTVT